MKLIEKKEALKLLLIGGGEKICNSDIRVVNPNVFP